MKKLMLTMVLLSGIFLTSCKENPDTATCEAHAKNCPKAENCPEHPKCEAHEKCAKSDDCAAHPECEVFEHKG